MLRKMMFLIVMMLLTAYLMSCAKLPESQIKIEGNVKMEIAKLGDSIPMTWGSMISVSSVSQFPGWVQVWFQDNNGNVYMIPYHVESNTFHTNYRYMKRK